MREEIEQLIEDYKRRKKSAEKMMSDSTSFEQCYRVSGKREAYLKIIMELKEVLSHETNNQHRSDGRGTDDTTR